MSWSQRQPRTRVAAISACVAMVLATPALGVLSASAAPVPTPAAPPCITETRNNPISQFTSYTELERELQRLQQVSAGRLTVEEVGKSNRGRSIWAATVGTGDKVFLSIAEIHGNEKVGPDATLRVLEWLATSNSRQAQIIRSEVTLVAVPKMNPDGAELDRRGNDRTWAEVVAQFPQLAGSQPAWNYIQRVQQGDDYTNRPGFDLNRDFHPDLNYVPRAQDFPGSSEGFGFFINPESQVLRDLYLDLRAEHGDVHTFLDIHHQGACVARDDTNELIDVAVDYPPLPDVEFEPGGKYAQLQNRQDFSRQLAISAFDGIEREGYLGVRYGHAPERDIPGQARSAFALNGTGTVLFEIRGQTQNLGARGRERFTRATVAGFQGMLIDLATGAVNRIDPGSYDTLPGSITLRPDGSVVPDNPAAQLTELEELQLVE